MDSLHFRAFAQESMCPRELEPKRFGRNVLQDKPYEVKVFGAKGPVVNEGGVLALTGRSRERARAQFSWSQKVRAKAAESSTLYIMGDGLQGVNYIYI